jgi:MarR family 2-MHQ and catechol resistance regulon transcriptional repressor
MPCYLEFKMSTPDSASSAVHLRLVLWKAAKAVEQIDRASISSTGLCLSDFTILEVLLHKGSTPVNTIGRKVLLTSGSMTTAIGRLQQRGLVRRKTDPKDRRVTNVDLTAKGRQLIEQAFEQHRTNLERAFQHLDQNERAGLQRLLKKLGLGLPEAESLSSVLGPDAVVSYPSKG